MISPVKIWRGQKKIPSLLGKVGEILYFTIIRVPPKGFSEIAPYAVGIIKLSDNTKVIGQIVDCPIESIKIGQKVISVVRRMPSDDTGVIHYSIKFACLT